MRRESVGTAAIVFSVALLATVPYLNTLGHGFLSWDDNIVILGQPFLRSWSWENVWTVLSPLPAREEWLPLRDLTLLLTFSLLGNDPCWFAAGNVFLHATASIAVFFLLWRLAGGRTAAAFGALLFACHAVHVESVTWLSGRKDPLSAIFLVCALLAHIRWRSGEGRYPTVLVLLVLAQLSKASSFVFPLWAIAYDLFYRRDLGLRSRVLSIVPYLVVALVGIVTFLVLISTDGVIEEYPAGGLTTVLLTNVVLFKDYALASLVPWRHQAIYDVRFVTSILDLELWASVAFLAALGWFAWRFRSVPWISFGLAFFVANLIPYLNIVPHGIYYAERYLYLPSITVSLWLGIACGRMVEGEATSIVLRRLVVLGLCLVLAIHACLIAARNQVWADSVTFWTYQASRLPEKPAPLMNLAETKELSLDDAAAARIYAQVLDRFGEVPEAIFRLARIARRQCDLPGARALYELYAGLAPGDPRALNNLGETLLAQGDARGALEMFEKAVEKHSRYLLLRANLARVLETQGRREEALRHWRHILGHVELVPQLELAREAEARIAAPPRD